MDNSSTMYIILREYIYIYNFSKCNYIRNECMSINKVIQFRIFFLTKISSKSILIYSIYDRYKFEYLYSYCW